MPSRLLTVKQVDAAIAKGERRKITDGAGLYLQTSAKGQASWVYQYRFAGTTCWMSIGPAATWTLEEARNKHLDLRRLRDRGTDPKTGLLSTAVRFLPMPATHGAPAAEAIPAPKGPMFADALEAFLTVRAGSYKVTSKEPAKYRRLKAGAFGQLSVDAITVADVEALLKPMTPCLADKDRMRVQGVIDYATAKGWRTGPNPAAKSIMKHLLPAVPKSKPHAAMELSALPGFYADLIADGSPAARSLALAILTGGRTAEARDMRFEELSGDLWTIPGGLGERSMKESIEHEVPLVPAALSLIGEPKPSGLVFGKLVRDALLDKLNELRPNVEATVHGMRAVFRTWVQDHTDFDWRVAEKSLAHAVGTETERRYARGQMMTKRTALLQAWADFVTGRA